MSKRPVIIYGVTGYTGRLVAEYLREYRVPFIAAGRDGKRVQEVMSKIPGIENADYEVAEVEHTTAALTKLFEGTKVVCNMVGPFIQYRPQSMEAALAVGTHYTDTAGEQNWMLEAEKNWGDAFAKKGLLLAPGIAQMYTTGEIAANICLETPGLDTLDILVLWRGFPTYASTQTIFTILTADFFYLEQNQYAKWPATASFEVVVPGQRASALALPWGGDRASRVVQERSARGQLQGARRRLRSRRHARRRADDADGRGEDQAAAPGSAGEGAFRCGSERSGRDAAAREPAHQLVTRFGACERAARLRALRDPRQLQLQADGIAAGVYGLSSVAGGAAASGLRVGLSGVRSPGAARRAAELRPGRPPDPDGRLGLGSGALISLQMSRSLGSGTPKGNP